MSEDKDGRIESDIKENKLIRIISDEYTFCIPFYKNFCDCSV